VTTKYIDDSIEGKIEPEYNSVEQFMNHVKDREGLILEFGVATGRTINQIASLTDDRVYGFDSFNGLPEDWRPGILKGEFKQEQLPDVRDNVELVVGLFDDTLDKFLEEHPGPIKFCHVDCDLYSSTKTILSKLEGRVVEGSVFMFDEFCRYEGYQEHEYKAFLEFLDKTGWKVKYLGSCHYESFTFELVK
jgi:hypothetical protein